MLFLRGGQYCDSSANETNKGYNLLDIFHNNKIYTVSTPIRRIYKKKVWNCNI